MIEKKERNNILDFLRGFAALWIILIHTCFHSGDAYVPILVKQIVLIIDVPLFMFLSGYTLHYSEGFEKNIKRLVKMYLYYLVFLLVLFIVAVIKSSEVVNLPNIIKAMFFQIPNGLPLKSFQYSIWFIPMYFIVTSIGSAFLKKDNLKLIHLIVIFVLYGLSLYYFKISTLSMILMYLFTYCLGYYSYYNKLSIKKFIIFIIAIIGLNILLKYFGEYGFRKMQDAKFDYDITYLIYSMISIVISWFIITRIKIKTKGISFIGKNALLLYFCQCFSSSILFYIEPLIKISWQPKLLILFLINISSCLLIFTVFYWLFKLINPLINRIINK